LDQIGLTADLCENSFLTKELEGARPEEKQAKTSYETANREYDDAFNCLAILDNPEQYKILEVGISHESKYREQGLPKDGFHVALLAQPVRLNNGFKMVGIDPDEQRLRELRITVCKKARELYMEKQKVILLPLAVFQ
jgi:hypothetical protein